MLTTTKITNAGVNAVVNDRTKSIGGSDIAAILGVSPFKSSYELYLSKTNSIYIDQETNLAMEIGTELESFVLEKYKKKHGITYGITSDQLITDKEKLFKTHKDYNFLSSNLDAITMDGKTIIEVKTSSSLKGWEDGMPEHYKMQVAHYANIWDVEKVIVVLLVLGSYKGMYEFVYERNPELESKITDAAVFWWDECIIKGNPPKCTAGDVSDYLKAEVKSSSKIVARIEKPTIIGMCKQNNEMSDRIKEASAIIKKNNSYIANIIREADTLKDEDNNILATYKVITKKGGIDVKKLEEGGIEVSKYLKDDVLYRQMRLYTPKSSE